MAIVFGKISRKKDLYSLIILIVLLVIFALMLFSIFQKKSALIDIKPEEIDPPKINFSNLENPILKLLEPYDPPEEFQGDIGRENPFSSPQKNPTSPKK